ncbi:MAG: hypothetical protein H6748_01185 [Spirochaetaceae bacterium]|nr:hypothetical protein [Spirochaetaceae bacterium]
MRRKTSSMGLAHWSVATALAGCLVLALSPAHAQQVVVEVSGPPGTNGASAIGGVDGADGGDAPATVADGGPSSESVRATARGGAGGAGGRSLTPRTDGSGGSGGRGGDATASATTIGASENGYTVATAIAGVGGQGGEAAFDGGGVGGDGGRGGDANAHATSDSNGPTAYSLVRASGGTGGTASGTGARTGDGGDATASGAGHSADYTRVNLTATGGAGGSGSQGADSGDGGDAFIGADAATASVSDPTGSILIEQGATGGRGGNSSPVGEGPGAGGHGGDGRVDFGGSSFDAGMLSVRLDSSGGYGGNGSTAGRGGQATTLGSVASTGEVSLHATAYGGPSGSAADGSRTSGGNGRVEASAHSISGDATTTAIARGGVGSAGGDASARGIATTEGSQAASAGATATAGASGGVAHASAEARHGVALDPATLTPGALDLVVVEAVATGTGGAGAVDALASSVIETQGGHWLRATSRAAAPIQGGGPIIAAARIGSASIPPGPFATGNAVAEIQTAQTPETGLARIAFDLSAPSDALDIALEAEASLSGIPIEALGAIHLDFGSLILTESGFEALDFAIEQAGATLLDRTFSDGTMASMFFSSPLDLGGLDPSAPADLRFVFSVRGAGSETRAAVWLEVSYSVIPEPGTGVLLLVGLTMLARRGPGAGARSHRP